MTRRFIGEVLVYGTFLAIFLCSEFNVIPVTNRGFICGDLSISHKSTRETISALTLMIVTIPVQFLILWTIEGVSCAGKDRPIAAWKVALRVFQEYIYGTLFLLAAAGIAKNSVGELRPTFMDTCKPDKMATCSPGEFVPSFLCTNREVSLYNDLQGRKSFPSGHTYHSVYQAIFSCWYLQRRFSRRKQNPCVVLLQFIFVSWAVFCSISRMNDNRHHWWDVLAGICIGIVFGVLSCKLISRDFAYFKVSEDNQKITRDHNLSLEERSTAISIPLNE